MGNLWLDMPPEVKIPILKKAIEYGWLKEDFVQEFILLEENTWKKEIGDQDVSEVERREKERRVNKFGGY